MSAKTAGLIFLGICVLLAVLLLTVAISPVISGGIFTASLLLLGGFSSGFRRK